MVCAWRGGGRGNLRVAKTPPLQSGVCGDSVATHRLRPPFATTWASTGTANGRITTRRAASLIKTADLHGWKARRAWYPHGGNKGRRLSIRISVGEVPSVASALPNQRGVKARSRRVAPRRWKNRRVPIGGSHEGGSRRGAPRRYVLRGSGELGLNRRIPKGKPRRKARRGSIVYRSPFLRVNRFQSSNSISRRS